MLLGCGTGSYVVRTVAYLSDNYAYIIEDKNTQCVQPLGATRLCASRWLPSIAASVPW